MIPVLLFRRLLLGSASEEGEKAEESGVSTHSLQTASDVGILPSRSSIKAIPNALKGKFGYVTSTWLQNQVCLALYICSLAVEERAWG